jgi:hypothetical protein
LQFGSLILFNLALLNFAGYNGAFDRKFEKQKKLFMTYFMCALALIDTLMFSWYFNRWLYFFFVSVPWSMVALGIIGWLEKALKKSEMFSNMTKKLSRGAITFFFVSAIFNMFLVMFFISIPFGVMGEPAQQTKFFMWVWMNFTIYSLGIFFF